jgi:Spy/CpxP family protein refolding chaperone
MSWTLAGKFLIISITAKSLRRKLRGIGIQVFWKIFLRKSVTLKIERAPWGRGTIFKEREEVQIMKKKVVRIVLSLLFVMLAGQYSYADDKPSSEKAGPINQRACPMMMPPPGPPECPKMTADIPGGPPLIGLPHFGELNLNDHQKALFKEIDAAARKEMIRKRADKEIAEIDLRELLDKESVDLKAVDVKLKQLGVIDSELQLTTIQSVEKMKSILTPEQRNAWKKAQQVQPRDKHYRPCEMMEELLMPPPFSEEENGGPGADNLRSGWERKGVRHNNTVIEGASGPLRRK